MAKLVVSRRPGAEGKMRNNELLVVSAVDRSGAELATNANACDWDDFLFHLGPITSRAQLHQADRDLRAKGTAMLTVNEGIVDEAWMKSFLLKAD